MTSRPAQTLIACFRRVSPSCIPHIRTQTPGLLGNAGTRERAGPRLQTPFSDPWSTNRRQLAERHMLLVDRVTGMLHKRWNHLMLFVALIYFVGLEDFNFFKYIFNIDAVVACFLLCLLNVTFNPALCVPAPPGQTPPPQHLVTTQSYCWSPQAHLFPTT